MRGRPFEPGNKMGKGRAPGSRNERTIYEEALEDHGMAIMKKVILLALNSDPMAMRLCVERLMSPRKAPNTKFRLPRVKSSADIAKAYSSLMQQVAGGKISPTDGAAMVGMMENYRRAAEGEYVDQRLRVLEQRNFEAAQDNNNGREPTQAA